MFTHNNPKRKQIKFPTDVWYIHTMKYSFIKKDEVLIPFTALKNLENIIY